MVFATDQTYELLQCLEEIEGLRELDGKGGEDDIVRLALLETFI